MRNRCILFFTDEAIVHVINKQSCKDKSLVFFVRKVVSVCLENNIVFKAKHIQGIKNTLADSLSRLQIQTFKQLALSHMDESPTEIPLSLQPHNWQWSCQHSPNLVFSLHQFPLTGGLGNCFYSFYICHSHKFWPRYLFLPLCSLCLLHICTIISMPHQWYRHTCQLWAASHAADQGMSDAQIRALGRWKSNAFQKYIRIPSLAS